MAKIKGQVSALNVRILKNIDRRLYSKKYNPNKEKKIINHSEGVQHISIGGRRFILLKE